MSNQLQYETSPYLLQHKDNPVNWYPWCKEAFERAKAEDKPIFLSIGYSTCHWCHVLAHESFEDAEIADLLNRSFISIKVDKEERPDIDSVYMAVCQTFTGSGGWPTSIFMTAEQKPFFAGTYFPKTSRGAMIGMRELLLAIHQKWEHDRNALLKQSDEIVTYLNSTAATTSESADTELIHSAVALYKRIYDQKYGGFGRAPKFPAPHNLLFLLSYYERYKDAECLQMAEHTLQQMYRGGLFDHIGFGFCRYSTDKQFLVPHFEKMLYDNALLIFAYCKSYAVTKKPLYLEIAQKTADYILREMTSPAGGFYSAQDADSEGEEGKYYLFTPDEILDVLGKEQGKIFNHHFDISTAGNFEGQNIPNLLKSKSTEKFDNCFLSLHNYRKKRHSLHLDDKILTSWNSLMIAAMCELYIVSGKKLYLDTAKQADGFIQKYLYENDTLFVSFRNGKRGVTGFLDDYADYIFAQLALYKATLDKKYIMRADCLCHKVTNNFGDNIGGYYLYGYDNEELIVRPKETYDGAIPSGNSIMAFNLVRLAQIMDNEKYRNSAERQLNFLAVETAQYPPGYAMYLLALLEHTEPPMKITVVLDEKTDKKTLPLMLPSDSIVILLEKPSENYPFKNGKTTYYVCKGHNCLPSTNDLPK